MCARVSITCVLSWLPDYVVLPDVVRILVNSHPKIPANQSPRDPGQEIGFGGVIYRVPFAAFPRRRLDLAWMGQHSQPFPWSAASRYLLRTVILRSAVGLILLSSRLFASCWKPVEALKRRQLGPTLAQVPASVPPKREEPVTGNNAITGLARATFPCSAQPPYVSGYYHPQCHQRRCSSLPAARAHSSVGRLETTFCFPSRFRSTCPLPALR